MIKNIIFDVGGVLIDIDIDERLKSVNTTDSKKIELVNIIKYDQIWNDTDLGKYDSFEIAFPEMIKRHREYKDELEQFFHKDWMNCYKLLAKGYSVFRKCIDLGFNVFILSNFSKDGFISLNERFTFFKEADDYLISSFVKIRKPDKRIFRLAEEKFDIFSSETIFIDDKEENCLSASSLGFNTIVYKENTIDSELKKYIN